jgi:hypothetical protein
MSRRKPAAVVAASFPGLVVILASAPSSLAEPAPDARDPDAPVCKGRTMMPYRDGFRAFGIYELSNGDRLRMRRDTKHDCAVTITGLQQPRPRGRVSAQ